MRVFARYADLFERTELAAPVDESSTVRSIIEYVRGLPGGEHLPENVLVAVNQYQATPDTRVTPGDEVALLPPMAGG